MSALARIFGSGKKGETQPSPQVAIQKLRETAEMLEKKTEFFEKKIEIEIATAKKCGLKNKRGQWSFCDSKNQHFIFYMWQNIVGNILTLVYVCQLGKAFA